MRVLLTGIAGQLGRLVARRLSEHHQVVGIDRRPALGLPPGVVHHRLDLRRDEAQQVVAAFAPEAVIHLGLVHNMRIAPESLYARNVEGTERLLRWVQKYEIKKLVLLSSGDAYGPSPANSHFISETTPLKASLRFPEVRTLVAVDQAVQAFAHRNPQTCTTILRPAHIVGRHVRNAPSNYLRLRVVPTQMGFDPMLQLIAELDVCHYLAAVIAGEHPGMFNVAGSAPVPLSRVLATLEKPSLPIPHFAFRAGLNQLWRWHLTSFVPPELDHIRFSTVLDTKRADKEIAFAPRRLLQDILVDFRAAPAA